MLHKFWGVDAALNGHERSIVCCLPVIHIKGDEAHLAVARSAQWSLSTISSVDVKIDQAERVAESATKLHLPSPAMLADGLIIVLIGPGYERAHSAIGGSTFDTTGHLSVIPWIRIQSDFLVRAQPIEEFVAIAEHHGRWARDTFDAEMKKVLAEKQSTLTPKAEAALLMLEGNTGFSCSETVLRAMAAAHVLKNAERFKKLHLLAENELKTGDVGVDLVFARYLRTLTA